MATFLLEIGTEELPADFSPLVIEQLEKDVLNDLKEYRLPHGAISCTTTPRRIALIVKDIASCANDLEEEKKGPPADKAFDKGKPTNAAVGFAGRLGIDIKDLTVKDTPKGEFPRSNPSKRLPPLSPSNRRDFTGHELD